MENIDCNWLLMLLVSRPHTSVALFCVSEGAPLNEIKSSM